VPLLNYLSPTGLDSKTLCTADISKLSTTGSPSLKKEMIRKMAAQEKLRRFVSGGKILRGIFFLLLFLLRLLNV